MVPGTRGDAEQIPGVSQRSSWRNQRVRFAAVTNQVTFDRDPLAVVHLNSQFTIASDVGQMGYDPSEALHLR